MQMAATPRPFKHESAPPPADLHMYNCQTLACSSIAEPCFCGVPGGGGGGGLLRAKTFFRCTPSGCAPLGLGRCSPGGFRARSCDAPLSTDCRAGAGGPSLTRGVLDHDQNVVPVGGHEDLVLFGADPEERQVVGAVQLFDGGAALGGHLGDQGGVLNGKKSVRLIESVADGDAFRVDDDQALHALVGVDPLHNVLDLRHAATTNEKK
mmetsp:Transcript_63521/g.104923  ORF Transcript_63521/g.104923 Transcript_63521/m.104923 type:complete len:208 (-) Transcript_63521:1-624(-)